MNLIKRIARHILRDEIISGSHMSLITTEHARALELRDQQIEELKVDCFQLSQTVHHHEKRIHQMAPEKQFLVVAVDGPLEQEMVYSSDGKTRITVRLPIGHPWKQATELAQQLELANLSLDRVRGYIGDDTEMRRKLLGLEPEKVEHHPV